MKARAPRTLEPRLGNMGLTYERAFGICERLLRGEIVEVTDARGQTWRATIDALCLVFRGEPCPILESADAYEVAVFLLARVARCSRSEEQ